MFDSFLSVPLKTYTKSSIKTLDWRKTRGKLGETQSFNAFKDNVELSLIFSILQTTTSV